MKGVDKNFSTTVKPGDKYNKLTVVSYVGKNKYGKKLFRFRCDCGNEKIMIGTTVKNGYSKSCGCISSMKSKKRLTTHGFVNTKVYRSWSTMKNRCDNPNYEHYHRYGGRGVTYDKNWSEFENFLADMGEPPTPKHQLDRIDNDGNYTKDNCRWVTPSENCNNRKIYPNATGYTGVNFKKHINKYQSVFYHNRKSYYVGVFTTPEEAYDARVEAIKKYNDEHGTNLKYVERDI